MALMNAIVITMNLERNAPNCFVNENSSRFHCLETNLDEIKVSFLMIIYQEITNQLAKRFLLNSQCSIVFKSLR